MLSWILKKRSHIPKYLMMQFQFLRLIYHIILPFPVTFQCLQGVCVYVFYLYPLFNSRNYFQTKFFVNAFQPKTARNTPMLKKLGLLHVVVSETALCGKVWDILVLEFLRHYRTWACVEWLSIGFREVHLCSELDVFRKWR